MMNNTVAEMEEKNAVDESHTEHIPDARLKNLQNRVCHSNVLINRSEITSKSQTFAIAKTCAKTVYYFDPLFMHAKK